MTQVQTQFSISEFLTADPQRPVYKATQIVARLEKDKDGNVIATDVAIRTSQGYICFWWYPGTTKNEFTQYLTMRAAFTPFFKALDSCEPSIVDHVETYSAPLDAVFCATVTGTFTGAHKDFRIALPEDVTVFTIKDIRH